MYIGRGFQNNYSIYSCKDSWCAVDISMAGMGMMIADAWNATISRASLRISQPSSLFLPHQIFHPLLPTNLAHNTTQVINTAPKNSPPQQHNHSTTSTTNPHNGSQTQALRRRLSHLRLQFRIPNTRCPIPTRNTFRLPDHSRNNLPLAIQLQRPMGAAKTRVREFGYGLSDA